MRRMDLDTIRSETASDLVLSVMQRLYKDCQVVSPRGMKTYEARWCKYVLHDVTRCACWLPHRKLNYPFMFAEFLWMFCGRNDVEMISYYNANITKFSDDGKTFYGAYGPPWRGQIDGVIQRLRNDPDSRQAVVCTWRREYNEYDTLTMIASDVEIVTEQDGYAITKDVPCTLTMQYLLRDGRLEAGVSMRSSDAWLGLPYDIFNFAMLQRAVAAELQVPCGELTLYVGSSHLYERNLEALAVVVDAVGRMPVRDLGEYIELAVPGPPNLAYERVVLAEAMLRDYEDGVNTVRPVAHTAWEPLLSMLAYRRHNNMDLVHESVRPLLVPA